MSRPLDLRGGRWKEVYEKDDLAAEILRLRTALSNCVIEIERLHTLHRAVYEGKVGEPKLSVAKRARTLLPNGAAYET